jgi:tetratricopeptide (TPR) repeat protein/5-hydroxyisourate hydrolase-like protein (transthyretin family)
MRVIVLFLFLVGLANGLYSQTKANEYYNAGYYHEAIREFEDFLAKEKSPQKRLDAVKKIADSYYQTRRVKQSLKYYQEFLNTEKTDSLALFRMMELYRSSCDYFMAGVYFNQFAELHLTCDICDFIKDYMFASRVFFPEKNTKVDERYKIDKLNFAEIKQGMGYTFYEDNKMIAGTERKFNENKTVFYDLALIDPSAEYKKAENLNIEGDSEFFRSYPSYDKNNKVLYFTSNASDKKNFKPNKADKYGYSKDGTNVLQIYAVKKKGKGFSEPELLPFNDNNYNFTHPAISSDGNTLYFVSDKPGGEGGYDLYYVTKKGRGWSEPVNCGPNVNTKYHEMTPYVLGDSLFFSSYGHDNYGGSDVFVSEIEEGFKFTYPKNMGLPVNSCRDDFAFVLNPDLSFAYLTSNRDMEDVDVVYRVWMPTEEFKVKDERGLTPIADVEVIITGDVNAELMTDNNGSWTERMSSGQKVEVTFENPYYETEVKSFSSFNNDAKESLKDVKLKAIILAGRTVDDITGNPISGVKVSLMEKNESGGWDLVEVQASDANGNWVFHVRKDRDYKVILSKDKYMDVEYEINKYNDSKELWNERIEGLNPFMMSYKPEKDVVMQIDNIYLILEKRL